MVRLYSFDLAFSGGERLPLYASFPFMMDGEAISGISCGLSSRFSGDMVYSPEGAAVGEQNPARLGLFEKLALDPAKVYGLKQIHSRLVLAVGRDTPPAVPADGMASADRELTLSVTVADCMPVYLFDAGSGAFALLHSGWKGTGIALKALELMAERWRTRPQEVAAVLGPCIDSCCYQADGERAAAFEAEFGGCPSGLEAADAALLKPVTRREENTGGSGPSKTEWYLDLKAANVRLLAGAGVRNIAVCNDCTFTDERLGSFRREGACTNGAYTRMAALMGYPLPRAACPPARCSSVLSYSDHITTRCANSLCNKELA